MYVSIISRDGRRNKKKLIEGTEENKKLLLPGGNNKY